MARPLVLDTTILIDALRHPERLPAVTRAFRSRRVWLTSVTIAELYAGARSPQEARLLDRIEDIFARAQRLVAPTPDEWRQTGQLIARAVRLYGALEPRDHLADVLIVVLAARLRGAVVTANRRHFDRWIDLARHAHHDVVVAAGDPLA